MNKKLEELKSRRAELEHLLSDPAVASDSAQCTKLARELSEIIPFVKRYDQLLDIEKQIVELRCLCDGDYR